MKWKSPDRGNDVVVWLGEDEVALRIASVDEDAVDAGGTHVTQGVVLPRSPSVKVVFWYIACIVSTTAARVSPNLSSTVHTLMPFGISLSVPSESVLMRLPVCGRNCESSLLLKSVNMLCRNW